MVEKVFGELPDVPVRKMHPDDVKAGMDLVYFKRGKVLDGTKIVKCCCKVANIEHEFRPPFTHVRKFTLTNEQVIEGTFEEGQKSDKDFVLVRDKRWKKK